MARVDVETLGADRAKVFVAFTLAEARAGEAALDARGVVYAVSVEDFGRTLFGSVRHGAVFSVSEGQLRHSALILTDAGLEKGLLTD